MKRHQAVDIRISDAEILKGNLFTAENPRAQVLILPGTGIKQGFYARYARFWQDHAFTGLTIDYRGIGDSCASLKQSRATMHGWGHTDVDAALQFLQAQNPDIPLLVIAHSVGGQILPLAPSSVSSVDALVLITSQLGYVGLWPRMQQPLLHILWAAMKPMTLFLGYFPSGALGMGENLPKEVALEWARWCRHPDHLFGFSEQLRPHHAALQIPLYSFSVQPDFFAPQAAVQALLKRYKQAEVTEKIVDESSLPRRVRLGHFGFFRKVGEGHWDDILQWALKSL